VEQVELWSLVEMEQFPGQERVTANKNQTWLQGTICASI